MDNKININNIINLCNDFLNKNETLHGLGNKEIDIHFYDAESFLMNIFRENIYNQNKFENIFKPLIQRYEYSKGGEFYNPIPEIELTLSKKSKSGKLFECKQKPDNLKFDFEYGFDSNDKLIKKMYNGSKKDNYELKNTTYIFYHNNFNVAFNFNWREEESINGIILSEYKNNKLHRYYYFFGTPSRESSEFFAKKSNIELYYYDYKEDELEIYYYRHFGSTGRFGRKTFLDIYKFKLDEDCKYKYIGLGEAVRSM